MLRYIAFVASLVFVSLLAIGQSANPNQITAHFTLTNQDIVQMVKAKFVDSTIIKEIQANETNFDLSVTALVALKNAGVSQAVIEEMLSVSARKKQSDATSVAAPQPQPQLDAQPQPTPPPPLSPGLKTAAPGQQPPSATYCPATLQPGAYYWSGNSWTAMQQINMSGGGAVRMGKLFVPGLTPQMVWTFRDAKAPVQLRDDEPRFCFKFFAVQPGLPFSPSGRDIVIARLDQKKSHRELQTTSGGNMFTFKSGLSKERTPEIEVTTMDSSTYLVSPKSPLLPGEYLLTDSSLGYSGYDFGFQPAK